MTRGEGTQNKIHYKGSSDDFLVFVDDTEAYKKWTHDSSIPLAHFVSTFKVFVTHKQGAQGQYDTAPRNILSSEFNTEDEEEAIKFILKNGTLQTVDMPGRQGNSNDSMSSMRVK
ncbi:Shwachman-Bodian-Diamond syndrome (SBDS) protein [Geosmithia morbida]|uniref:Shwachman-Bodian-Diamond syndrome (SBDS) protein n=1 Tax=Geosmithia morbida TaxID=1094350 RepID=A0A9P4YT22_9HYPO|nr:Shwachman-Bodian-Diamond syndrome (SBDS) protein [Geosmithia morbida]KAF4122588.1 Shwachman-Bodian-Diamond syndrome (SBDS) protein [Geosmithia morbida]